MEEKPPVTLLVVDDEPGIVDFTRKIYTSRGVVTFGATDGIEAVEIYRKERPQISLIDVHMPFSPIDGIETLKRIKDINKEAICIMVSRITEKPSIEASRSLGAGGYVMKPVELEDLDRVIFEVSGIKF